MKVKNLCVGLLLLSLGFVAGSRSYAQSLNNGSGWLNAIQNQFSPTWLTHHHKRFNAFSIKKHSLQKPTQIHSRIQAMVPSVFDTLIMGFMPQDSIAFLWTENRHQDEFAKYVVGNLLYYPGYSTYFNQQNFMITADTGFDYSWVPIIPAYNLQAKFESVFDAQGNLTSQITLNLNGGVWENSDKIVYTYDNQGNTTSETDLTWNNSDWENESMTTYQYDGQNNLTKITNSFWDNSINVWDSSAITINTYDAQNNCIISIYQQSVQAGATLIWQNQDKYLATYAGSTLTSEVAQNWDDVNNQWVNSEKQQYNYDGSGIDTSIDMLYWNSGNWENNGKYSLIYTGNNLTELIASVWDESSSQYYNIGRLAYTYNTYNQITSSVVSEWDGSQWSHTNGDIKLNFYYSTYDDGTGINKILPTGAFQVYPNPARNQLTIKMNNQNINRIQLINISGRIVFKSDSPVNTSKLTIPVSQLTDGAYLLRIQSGFQQGSKTIVVRH